jgi:hypothetical protein
MNLELEALTGATWRELAQLHYTSSVILRDDAPQWEDLPYQDQLGIEIGLRQIEAIANGSPRGTEYWRDFARKRMERRKYNNSSDFMPSKDRLKE